jgi:TPP-dependent indolepyruvate ferredoxin oxidoreductase alpha subunit
VRVVTEAILFAPDQNPALKISRLAVVPQINRRRRIIVNLSAQVDLPPKRTANKRRKTKRHRPSVNETTVPDADQTAVSALGSALPAILRFVFDTNCEREIDWQKIDLSDGFRLIIVADGGEFNFVYQLSRRPGYKETHYVVPSSLHMGWTNIPVYFCTAT